MFAALAGAGIGAAGNSLSQMWGAIAGHKAFKDQKSAIRHLRRREYQDMVFSMKQAGLNPMLATGATPGHSAVSAPNYGDGGDMAGAMTRGAASAMEADRQGPIIKKMGAEEDLATEKAAQAAFEREAHRAGLAYSLDNMKAINLNTAANTQKLIQETDESIARTQNYWAETAKTGVSAKEIQARARAAELENVGRENEANFRKTTTGRIMQEIGIGLGDLSKLVGPAAGFVLGRGTKGPTKQRMQAPTSAAGAASSPYRPSPGSYSTRGKGPNW